MGPSPKHATLHDVVPLLYRADWATLSLSATYASWTDHELRRRMRGMHLLVSPDGEEREPPVTEYHKNVLVAPGGKYRISQPTEHGQVRHVCDGETAWYIAAGPPWAAGESRAERWSLGRPPSGVADLLVPAKLLSQYTLELAGMANVGGRPAYRMVARPRLLGVGRPDTSPAQVHVLVDAGLGILLRREELFHGQPVERAELADLQLNPPEAADPGQFQPPPGMPEGEREPLLNNIAMPGLGGDAVRVAAGLAAKAMGFATRHWPEPVTGTASEMPPSAVITSADRLRPAGDDLVNLLHRTGLPAQACTAEVHTWMHGALLTELAASARESVLPPALDGILGPDAVWDAIAARERVTHQVDQLRLAAPRRYRIDRLAGGRPSSPDSTGCDGERLWTVHGSRVSARAARPLQRDLARLADPAWLLAGYTLSDGGPAEVDGRNGFLVAAVRPAGPDPNDLELPWLGSLADRVEAVLDASLGVVLRMTCFAAGRPVLSCEMRGLIPGAPGASVFEVPPGAHGGWPLDRMPSPADAAKAAAGLGMVGAAVLVGWLQKRPRSRP